MAETQSREWDRAADGGIELRTVGQSCREWNRTASVSPQLQEGLNWRHQTGLSSAANQTCVH